MLRQADPLRAQHLMAQAQDDVRRRWSEYRRMATAALPTVAPTATAGARLASPGATPIDVSSSDA